MNISLQKKSQDKQKPLQHKGPLSTMLIFYPTFLLPMWCIFLLFLSISNAG